MQNNDPITNPYIREALEAWLKFGTVFLIYRLCTYYFFDRNNPDAVLFDKESLYLVLFILIGFTIYYLIVKPFIPVKMEHPIFQNLTNDMLMFGTVLVSSHVMEIWMNGGSFLDENWLKTAGIIMLSFAAYDIIVYPFIPSKQMNQPNSLVNDLLKYGIFLVLFQVLQNKSVLNQKWILSVIFVLIGFTGYHLFTKRIIHI